MSERERFWRERSEKARDWLRKNYKWPQTNDEAEVVMLLATYGQASAREQAETISALKEALQEIADHSLEFDIEEIHHIARETLRESFSREAGTPK